MDFADALHLASAAGCEEFVTFDRALAKQGETLSGTRVRLL
jgi:predicted nucleic-acid-binding protein